MERCCPSNGYDDVFDGRFARHVARRYRRRGPSRAERRIIAFLVREGLDGATVLEIGGGVGELEVELIERGASRATNLEISAGYDAEAVRLAADRGLSDRMVRRRIDIADDPAAVEPADIVVLHRVVCCYADYERLLRAAGSHARRLLVLSYPPRHAGSRAFMTVQNLAFRLARKGYRGYTHPPEAMLGVLEREGLTVRYRNAGPVWHVAGLAR